MMASSISSREPPSQSQAQEPGTYSVDQSVKLMEQARNAQDVHLNSAHTYITGIFQVNKISYAVMGGYSLRIRGSQRQTYDIDVVVGCNMLRLIQILKPQNRVIRPLGPVADTVRIFVKTGGPIDLGFPEIWTEVDLILGGSMNTPNDPATALEIVSVGSKQYYLLNIRYTMSTKLVAFFARASGNDFNDLMFLVNRYPEQIRNVRAELSVEHRQAFVNALATEKPPGKVLTKVKYIVGIA